MKLKMNYLVITLLGLSIGKTWANCPEFDTALERVMARVTEREAGRGNNSTIPASSKWGSKEATQYKLRFENENRGQSDNRQFISQMSKDQKDSSKNTLYFDVENAVQKKLNDSLVADKEMVDAINNSFMTKFNNNLKADPELMSRLQGQYQDFKSLRLRLELKPGDDALLFEKKLDDLYKKTNTDFVADFENSGMTKLIPPRTDEVVDVSTWFLSGVGDTVLEANMAARNARSAGFLEGSAKTVRFKDQVNSMHADINSIESLRKSLTQNEGLIKSGVMARTSTGEIIPSKDMIGVLRKIKMADCENLAEYNAKIRAKTKTLFDHDISDQNIEELTAYFQKVDSLSPPLFQRDRINIDLGEAKSGIVSVDFAGVGVDNAYEQMRALSVVNYAQKDKLLVLKDAYAKVQTNVDTVTEDMNMAKRAFGNATNDKVAPRYSGDDGILMPDTYWETAKKQELLRGLAKTGDPAKFRVTFVKTEFSSGSTIPAMERSGRVVRAEGIEKSLRELVIGTSKIPSERAKKMIFAIDSRPEVKGGKFNLIIGGERPSPEELKLIEEAFKKTMKQEDGESAGVILEAFN